MRWYLYDFPVSHDGRIFPWSGFLTQDKYIAAASTFADTKDIRVYDGMQIDLAASGGASYAIVHEQQTGQYDGGYWAGFLDLDMASMQIPQTRNQRYTFTIDPFVTLSLNASIYRPAGRWFGAQELLVESSSDVPTAGIGGVINTAWSANVVPDRTYMDRAQQAAALVSFSYEDQNRNKTQHAWGISGLMNADGMKSYISGLIFSHYKGELYTDYGPEDAVDNVYKNFALNSVYIVPAPHYYNASPSVIGDAYIGYAPLTGVQIDGKISVISTVAIKPSPEVSTAPPSSPGMVTIGNERANVQVPYARRSGNSHRFPLGCYFILNYNAEKPYIWTAIGEAAGYRLDLTDSLQLKISLPPSSQDIETQKLRQTISDVSNVSAGVVGVASGMLSNNPMAVIGGTASLLSTAADIATRPQSYLQGTFTPGGMAYFENEIGADFGYSVYYQPYDEYSIRARQYSGCNIPFVLTEQPTPIFVNRMYYIRGSYMAPMAQGRFVESWLQKRVAEELKQGVSFYQVST